MPIGFIVASTSRGGLSAENALYVLIGLTVLTLFSAMLGIHQV